MATKKTTRDLPPNVTEADLTHDYKNALPYAELPDGMTPYLTFYKVPSLGGWILLTLHISNASSKQKARGNTTARSYAISVVGEKLCRAGKGPHVTDEVTVYLSKTNIERLRPYTALWVKGMTAAGTTRDRISSRRAQGQQMRAEGRSQWRWDS